MAVTTSTVPQLAVVKRSSTTALAVRRFLRNRVAFAALVLILLEVLVAVFAQYIAPYEPYRSDYSVTYQGPSANYLLGVDDQGRDVLSRIIYGPRVSYTGGVLRPVLL